MLAEAIPVHGDIGYKFCWLLPSQDQNQGILVDWTPINRTYTSWAWNHIASKALSSQPKMGNVSDNPKQFIASKA